MAVDSSVHYKWIGNLRGPVGKKGDKGDKGDTGTIDFAEAYSVASGEPADARMVRDWRGTGVAFDVPRGLPGVNAIPADEAVAAYVRAIDSETRDALDDTYVQRGEFEYFTVDYGVPGDGVTNATQALLDMIDQVPDGGTIKARPGERFLLDRVEVVGRELHFDFSQATIIKNNNTGETLHFVGSWSDIMSASGVVTDEMSTRIDVGDTSVFSTNDVVRVFSDNENREARSPRESDPNDTRYPHEGEFSVVTGVNVEEGYLRLHPPLFGRFTQNVRIARIDKKRVTLRVGDAYPAASAGGGEDFRNGFIRFEAVYRPEFVGYVQRAPGSVLTFRACWQPEARIKCDWAPYADGYVVNDQASTGGQYDITAGYSRHAFTDNCPMLEAESTTDDPAWYGRPMYARVTLRSNGGSNDSAVDTHHGGVGHTFVNCHVTGLSSRSEVENDSTSGVAAYKVRGCYMTFINCRADGVDTGWRITDEATYGRSWKPSTGVTLMNCETRRTRVPIFVNKSQLESYADYPTDTLTVVGGYYESNYAASAFVNSRTRFEGPRFVFTNPLGPQPTHSSFSGATLLDFINGGQATGSLSIDASAITSLGSSQSMSSVMRWRSGAGTNILALDVSARLPNIVRDVVPVFVDWGSAIGRVNVTTDTEFGAMEPGAFASNRMADEQSMTVTVGLNRDNGRDDNGCTKLLFFTVPDRSRLIHHSADPVVTARVRNASGQAQAINDIGNGAFGGQILCVQNAITSNASVSLINNSVSNTNFGANGAVSLAPGHSYTAVWDSVMRKWTPAFGSAPLT